MSKGTNLTCFTILIRLTVKWPRPPWTWSNRVYRPDKTGSEPRSQPNTLWASLKTLVKILSGFQKLVFLLGYHWKKRSLPVLKWRLPILAANALISWDQLWTWGQSISSATKWRLEISNLIATSHFFLSTGSSIKVQSPKYRALSSDWQPHSHEGKTRNKGAVGASGGLPQLQNLKAWQEVTQPSMCPNQHTKIHTKICKDQRPKHKMILPKTKSQKNSVTIKLWHLDGASGKESSCQCRRRGFDPGIGKISWRRGWQSTPVFLPEELHGQRSLPGYSPYGHTESDTTEAT